MARHTPPQIEVAPSHAHPPEGRSLTHAYACIKREVTQHHDFREAVGNPAHHDGELTGPAARPEGAVGARGEVAGFGRRRNFQVDHHRTVRTEDEDLTRRVAVPGHATGLDRDGRARREQGIPRDEQARN
jgi:hypothetical protein